MVSRGPIYLFDVCIAFGQIREPIVNAAHFLQPTLCAQTMKFCNLFFVICRLEQVWTFFKSLTAFFVLSCLLSVWFCLMSGPSVVGLDQRAVTCPPEARPVRCGAGAISASRSPACRAIWASQVRPGRAKRAKFETKDEIVKMQASFEMYLIG